MIHITIGGRKFALAFTLAALDGFEEVFGKALDKDTLAAKMGDRHALVSLFRILGEQGEALEGRELDVDEKWIAQRLRVADLPRVQNALLAAITEGMRMETDTQDEDEEVDVVLEELKKKEQPAG